MGTSVKHCVICGEVGTAVRPLLPPTGKEGARWEWLHEDCWRGQSPRSAASELDAPKAEPMPSMRVGGYREEIRERKADNCAICGKPAEPGRALESAQHESADMVHAVCLHGQYDCSNDELRAAVVTMFNSLGFPVKSETSNAHLIWLLREQTTYNLTRDR